VLGEWAQICLRGGKDGKPHRGLDPQARLQGKLHAAREQSAVPRQCRQA
jgi:hypothetical protein